MTTPSVVQTSTGIQGYGNASLSLTLAVSGNDRMVISVGQCQTTYDLMKNPPTCNGTPMRRIFAAIGGAIGIYVYALEGVPAGTATSVWAPVKVSDSTAMTTAQMQVINEAWIDCNQTNAIPFADGVSTQYVDSPKSASVTVPAGGAATSAMAADSGIATAFVGGTGQTEILQIATATGRVATSYKAGGGTTTMSQSWTGGQRQALAHVVMGVAPAAVAATVPDAPTIGTATPGSGQVSVAFTAPANDGGAAISGYTATLYKVSDNTSAGTNTGATSPIVVTATNGTPVYAKVKATNSVGAGAESAASSNVTPTTTATAIVVSGPTTGSAGVASSNFTVSANGPITGTVVVTPAATGCTFTPSTISISSGTPTGTFTVTAATAGAKTISFTNNGSLTNQANLTYTAAAAVTITSPAQGGKYAANGVYRASVACNAVILNATTLAELDRKTGLTSPASGAFVLTSTAVSSGTRVAVLVRADANGEDIGLFFATAV